MNDITKDEIVQRIRDAGVIAIVRLDDNDQLTNVAEAIEAGGLDIIEFTMTTPGALDIIAKTAAENEDILIGAGTVLDADTARDAIEAGAQFIVSPITDPRVIAAAHEFDKAVLPGAFTPTEIYRAMEIHADFVKLFPASAVGPDYMRAIKAPLPEVEFVPTGGINLSNAAAFLDAGAAAIAIGSDLVNNRLVREGRFQDITRNAQQFAEIVAQSRAG